MFIINETTDMDVTHSPSFGRGCIPRNFTLNPVGSYSGILAAAVDMPTKTDDEIKEIIKYRKETNQTMRNIRRTRGPAGGRIPSLDQNGIGYCWCHSGTGGVILRRATMGQPFVKLSAFMVGCLMKNYQDRGGWGADGVDFIIKNGVSSEAFWPQRSMDRKNDTEWMRKDAALYKISEGWIDLPTDVWDRTLTHQQVKTMLAVGDLVIGDFNWWGHSVLLFDLDIVDGEICPVGLNSWSDGWGEVGEFTLQGKHAIIDGGVGLRTVIPTIPTVKAEPTTAA